MTAAVPPVPDLVAQADRLVALGLHERSGLGAEQLRAAARALDGQEGLLALHPDLVSASALTPLVRVGGREAFVVADLDDVDAFVPVPRAAPPDSPVYLVHGLDRGDAMRGWSPDEALPALASAGRTPLTTTEGLHWLLQQPEAFERGACFMTVGSRRVRPDGRLDARTPALWFSNGTGRDGAARRHAPKLGWCWAGNRHTWLGFASAAGRAAVVVPASG